MTLLLAISGWDEEAWRARFRAELPDMDIVLPGEPFDRREVRYAASWKHPPGALAGLPNLEAIFSLGAGVDHLFNDPRLPDVPIARVVDPDLTTRMSEYIALHCLMILRQQRLYDRRQQERLWLDDRDQPAAKHVRVGILGLGELGQDAAAKLGVLGFDVAGWSRSHRALPGMTTFSGTEGLNQLLVRSDILVCLLPLTPETRGLLDGALFAKLSTDGKRHASLDGPHLINAARGGLQKETDILAALNAGTLASATLDVFDTEPLPPENPLWHHPKVTVTPHNAAMSAPDAIAALIARQIRNLEADGTLDHGVGRQRGY
ncbi:MAG: 2-hydroxyacid dehydrogenase [Bosea sp. (in: a-proteobacteria)]